MVRVLDIISDYLRLRGYPHQRLDGSTPAAARHAAMEAFNRPDSPDFAFLLSTRVSGGPAAGLQQLPSSLDLSAVPVSRLLHSHMYAYHMAASYRVSVAVPAGWWSGHQPGHC